VRRRGISRIITALAVAAVTSGCVTISPLAATGDFPVASGVQLSSTTYQRMMQRNGGKGQIIIGVKNDQPGLGYYDPTSHSYTGFDIEIAELIAAGLGFNRNQTQFVPIQSINRENAIQNQSVDLVIASYSYTAQRALSVNFAGPYFETGEALMVRNDEPNVTGFSSFNASNRICSVVNSAPLTLLPHLTSAVAVERTSYSECVADLDNHSVDAVYTDLAVLAGYAALDPTHLKIVPTTGDAQPQYYGIGLPLGDSALKAKINDILATAERNGTWQAIFNATLAPSGIKASAPPIGVFPASS
jgi:glutamate transport system substrate-binding protein